MMQDASEQLTEVCLSEVSITVGEKRYLETCSRFPSWASESFLNYENVWVSNGWICHKAASIYDVHSGGGGPPKAEQCTAGAGTAELWQWQGEGGQKSSKFCGQLVIWKPPNSENCSQTPTLALFIMRHRTETLSSALYVDLVNSSGKSHPLPKTLRPS